MASSSPNHGYDDHDTAPPSLPHEYNTVLSPVENDHEQIPVDNTDDPRDGCETFLSSDEDGGDVRILTE
ncbi:hypothetical protein A2U01_0080843, partial [Trifolium medium]|nr:hypothetical protein [Trifolium medium]